MSNPLNRIPQESHIEDFNVPNPKEKNGILTQPNRDQRTVNYQGKHLDKEKVCEFIESTTVLKQNIISNMTEQDILNKLDSLKTRVKLKHFEKFIDSAEAAAASKVLLVNLCKEPAAFFNSLSLNKLNNIPRSTLEEIFKNRSALFFNELSEQVLNIIPPAVFSQYNAYFFNHLSKNVIKHAGFSIFENRDMDFLNTLNKEILTEFPWDNFQGQNEELYRSISLNLFNYFNEATLSALKLSVFKDRKSWEYHYLEAETLNTLLRSVFKDQKEELCKHIDLQMFNQIDPTLCAALSPSAFKERQASQYNLMDDKNLKKLPFAAFKDHHTKFYEELDLRILVFFDDATLAALPSSVFKERDWDEYNMLEVKHLKKIPPFVFEGYDAEFYSYLDDKVLNCIPPSVIDHFLQVIRNSTNKSEVINAAKIVERFKIPKNDPRFIEVKIHLTEALSEDRKNPYTIHEKLLQNHDKPLLSFGAISGKQILTEGIAKYATLSPSTIGKLKEIVQFPLPTLDQMQALYKSLTQKEAAVLRSKILSKSLASYKSACIDDPFIKDIYRTFTESDETPIGRISFQFAVVMQQLLLLDNETNENELSLREEVFLKFMDSMLTCKTGKADGITLFYQSLTRKKEDFILNSQKQAPYLHKFVEQCLTQSITDDLVRAICKMKSQEPLPQGVHQTQFLHNCLLPRVGLKMSLHFDIHARLILNPLLDLLDNEKQMSESIRTLGNHFTPILFKSLKETFGILIQAYQDNLRFLKEVQIEIERLKNENPEIRTIQEQLQRISAHIAQSQNPSEQKAALLAQREPRLKLDQAIANDVKLTAIINEQKKYEENIEAASKELQKFGWELKEEVLSPDEESDLLLQKTGYLRTS